MLALMLPFGLAFGGLAAIGAIAGIVAAVLWRRQAAPKKASSQDGKTIHAEKGSRLKHRLSTGQKVLLPRSAGRPEKKQEMEQK